MVDNVAPAMWYAKPEGRSGRGATTLSLGVSRTLGRKFLSYDLVVKLTADEAAAVRKGDWLVIRGDYPVRFLRA